METLQMEATRSTPAILFDPISGTLSMSGESYPENSFEFYKPVLSWVSRFTATCQGPITLRAQLSYLNTGSTKCVMDILDILEDCFLRGGQVAVNWYYDHGNDRALETAEEFKEETTMPFNIVGVDERA